MQESRRFNPSEELASQQYEAVVNGFVDGKYSKETSEHLGYLQEYWSEQLSHGDWYVRMEKDLEKWVFPITDVTENIKALRDEFYTVVEQKMKDKSLPLATNSEKVAFGPSSERLPITTIVLHHVDMPADTTLDRLNALGLVRIYADTFLHDTDATGIPLKGRPIWSNVSDTKGNMVFYSYHYAVRENGHVDQLIRDQDVGWHAGNSEINRKSMGIVLIGDYTNRWPTAEQIISTTTLLNDLQHQYPAITPATIIGHNEVRSDRTCPGPFFLGPNGWKTSILQGLKKRR